MSNKSVHYIYQDTSQARIYKPSEDWETLKAWYTENGIDIGTVVDEGETIVEDGKVRITAIKPMEGQKPRRQLPPPYDLYEYRIPVTPLPKELFS